MEGPYLSISESLSLLDEKETECQSFINSAQLKDHILSLKLGLPFLETFLHFSNNEDLKLRIDHVVYTVRRELQSLSNTPVDESLILHLDHAYTDVREKMKNVIIEPETREYGVIFPKLFSGKGDFKKINDFLLESFMNLSSWKASLVAPIMKEIEDIKEKLLLLQVLLTYVADTGVYLMEENKELFTPLVDFLDKAACCLYSCVVDKIDKEMALAMKHKLSDLLEGIKVKEIYMVVLRASEAHESIENPLESELCLLDNAIKLLDCNASPRSYLNGPSEKLHAILKSLKAFLSDQPHELRLEKFNYLITCIDDITGKAIPILYSCYDKDMKEGMVREVNGALSEVLDQIKNIEEEFQDIKPYSYPETDGLGFLDFFLGHVEELLKCRSELIEILKNQIETLHVDFDFLRSFLRRIVKQHDEDKELEHLWTCIIRLAYQAEYVIDLFLVKNAPDPRIKLSLSKIMEQTKLVKSKVSKIYVEEKYHTQAHDAAKTSIHVSSKATYIATDEIVGFKDEERTIMEYLIGGREKLDIISIVGMAGLGKTTLARKIYQAPLIVEYFDVRAWCSASQTYQRRELLLSILDYVTQVTNEINKLDDHELATKLVRSLKGHRYLIVIDDLWDIKDWDDFKRYFPDDRLGSRILITTRLQSLAPQIKVDSIVHHLRHLYDDESWELFQKILLKKDRFPQEFWDVGQQIAHSCKGLPFAIVMIAGILAKVEKSTQRWKEIAASLSSRILSGSESQGRGIFELSYNHLPNHLRSCFLYFGAFPKDEEISVLKLKWLWTAEGFVRNIGEKSSEDVAEEYVMDLIDRSLVLATKERSDGGVKACRLQDLLRDFCLEKAKEESFLQVIHVDHWSKFSRVYDQRRLKIHSKVYDLVKAKPFGYCIRSLLYTDAKEDYFDRDVSFICQNFKLLRVLDLACLNIEECLRRIELLIHLRYLAIGTKKNSILALGSEKISIPSSIAKLQNLQFLLVRANNVYSEEVVDVPDSLWFMVNLRHVHIDRRAFFNFHPSGHQNPSVFVNLETLSTPCFDNKDDLESLLRRLPKLQKLGCVFPDCWDYTTNWHEFPALDFLGQLMSLKVFFKRSSHWGERCEFTFPLNLTKLTLSNFLPPWDDISKIGRTLPNLRVLKINGKDWDKTWIVEDEDFPKLSYLKLSSLVSIREWVASEDSFPVLEQLTLDNCKYLNEIPPCFGEVPTLRKIIVRDCKPSINDSARGIQKEQVEEMYNEELEVYIYPRK